MGKWRVWICEKPDIQAVKAVFTNEWQSPDGKAINTSAWEGKGEGIDDLVPFTAEQYSAELFN